MTKKTEAINVWLSSWQQDIAQFAIEREPEWPHSMGWASRGANVLEAA